LTSRSLSKPGTDTAAGDTPDKDPSSSNQQDAKPESADIVHSLKSVVTANKETVRTQPVIHEVQDAKGNVTYRVAELSSLPQNQGTATKAAQETGISAVPAPETASSVLGVADLAVPAGVAEPAGRVVGTPQANVNWGQVEKAQVVSQIVERAQLLGKNQSELMVVLKPEFLGRVNLHAAMVDNQLVATIIAESPSVKQMLEGQLSSLHTALHEQGLPVAKVEVVQGSQLSFADLGAGQGSSQQHLESGKSQLPPSFARYENSEESVEVIPQEARIYAPPTSRSLNLVA
jgi:flagellar hook-length control protein FliK